jgi:hypothetical protein
MVRNMAEASIEEVASHEKTLTPVRQSHPTASDLSAYDHRSIFL